MRQPKLIAVTGKKGIGKSVKTLTDLFSKYSNNRKILLIDVNSEYGNFHTGSKIFKVKRIGLKDIALFSNHPVIEPRRLVLQNQDGTYMDFEQKEAAICQAIETFRNGCLVIEDLNTVFGDSLPVRISGLLCNNRQRNADVFIHLQSIGRVLPKMYQNINLFRLHKQYDAIEQSQNKLGAEYEMFKIAYTIVENQYNAGNHYCCVYVDRDDSKIKGAFSMSELKQAVNQHLQSDIKHLNSELNKRDNKGRKVNNYTQALNILSNKLFQKYYQN